MSDGQKYIDFINNNIKQPDKNVFHYTHQKNYDEISRHKYFILNSHHYLNEKSKENEEIKPGLILVKSCLENSDFDQNQIQLFDDYISKGIVYYSSSFSLKGGDSLLHENYGEYCIEIDDNELKLMGNQKLTLFLNVAYSNKEKNGIIKELISIYNQSGKENIDFQLLIVYLTAIIPMFKEEKNDYERECRVIQIEGFTRADFNLGTPLASKIIRFNPSSIIGVSKS